MMMKLDTKCRQFRGRAFSVIDNTLPITSGSNSLLVKLVNMLECDQVFFFLLLLLFCEQNSNRLGYRLKNKRVTQDWIQKDFDGICLFIFLSDLITFFAFLFSFCLWFLIWKRFISGLIRVTLFSLSLCLCSCCDNHHHHRQHWSNSLEKNTCFDCSSFKVNFVNVRNLNTFPLLANQFYFNYI